MTETGGVIIKKCQPQIASQQQATKASTVGSPSKSSAGIGRNSKKAYSSPRPVTTLCRCSGVATIESSKYHRPWETAVHDNFSTEQTRAHSIWIKCAAWTRAPAVRGAANRHKTQGNKCPTNTQLTTRKDNPLRAQQQAKKARFSGSCHRLTTVPHHTSHRFLKSHTNSGSSHISLP